MHNESGCDVINLGRFLDYGVTGLQIEQKEW